MSLSSLDRTFVIVVIRGAEIRKVRVAGHLEGASGDLIGARSTKTSVFPWKLDIQFMIDLFT